MLNNYSLYNNKNPELIINEPGILVYDNRNNFVLKFEVNYNSFSQDQLSKVIKSLDKEFADATNTSSLVNSDFVEGSFITLIENNNKYYKNIKTESSNLNFKFIKYSLRFFKDSAEVLYLDFTHSKSTIPLKMSDGDYEIEVEIKNIDNEVVLSNRITLILKTNYYSMSDNKSGVNKILFDKNEGDFSLEISPKSNKHYCFSITDIKSNNENIFYFNYYNKNDNVPATAGKIGSEIRILNDTQIEEYEKNPELVGDIVGEFIFNIREILTTTNNNNSIGRIRIPTMKEKVVDNMMPYYNLKCDVSNNYETTIKLNDKLLITDQFKNEPLFYNFIVDDDIKDFLIVNDEDKIIENYKIKQLSKGLNLVYFSPKRGEKYYYKNGDNPYYLIESKKTYEPYYYSIIASNNISFDEGTYFDNIILKSSIRDDSVDLTIVYEDWSKKEIKDVKILKTDIVPIFLPDNRIKIDKNIRSIKISNCENLEIVNFISNCKIVRDNLVYYKDSVKDFVYYAEEVETIDINNIDDVEFLNMIIGERYAFNDGKIIKCIDGPITLTRILNSDVVFTDTDEYMDEKGLMKLSPMIVCKSNEFYNSNFKRAGAIVWEK
ncbi:MAG: hypothetical protein ACRC4T_18055 [Cetobacterium sp.]